MWPEACSDLMIKPMGTEFKLRNKIIFYVPSVIYHVKIFKKYCFEMYKTLDISKKKRFEVVFGHLVADLICGSELILELFRYSSNSKC